MGATGLELRLTEGRERAEVAAVTRTLNDVVFSLREIDKVYLLHGTRATWVVADMRRAAGDLVMRLEARLVPARRDIADMSVPVSALVEGAESLTQLPAVPRLFSPTAVTRLARLSAPGGGVQSVSLATYNGSLGNPVTLSDALKHNADAAVQPYEVSYGAVAGTLSGVRETRRSTVRVSVRDPIGKQAVDGFVPEAMAEELRDAWRHRVVLRGKVRRNSRGQAIRIDVDAIERLPPGDSSRPDPAKLLGVGADWLDGLTVDDFVREVRDA